MESSWGTCGMRQGVFMSSCEFGFGSGEGSGVRLMGLQGWPPLTVTVINVGAEPLGFPARQTLGPMWTHRTSLRLSAVHSSTHNSQVLFQHLPAPRVSEAELQSVLG